MLVCIDKITCARMYQRIMPRWKAKAAAVRAAGEAKQADAAASADEAARAALLEEAAKLEAQADWLEETIIEIIISEAQNEVADFKKWGFDIIPHRALMKQGFEVGDGKRVDVETAFKNPEHPFRVAIVCAMWLTGFDVECLSTLYIDKPMKAHTLMQAIARANRVYPGKDFGLIVDYNGMLKSLREALAQYALGDDGAGGEEIVAPIEERVQALLEAIEATETHLRGLGFDPGIARSARRASRGSRRSPTRWMPSIRRDEAKRRFEIMARQVFIRFKALMMEPTAFAYAERHDNIEAIYKKLTERRDTADVTELLKELHRIVNEAIRDASAGRGSGRGPDVRSQPDRPGEASRRVRQEGQAQGDGAAGHPRHRRGEAGPDAGAQSARAWTINAKYEEIVADYNREKDRTTIEETFRQLRRAGQQPRCGAEARDEGRAAARTSSRCSICSRRTIWTRQPASG